MTFIGDLFSEQRCCKKKTVISIIFAGGVVMLIVATIVVALVLSHSHPYGAHYNRNHDEHWSYDKQEQWGGLCQLGKHQSPIALKQRFAYKKAIPPIKLDNFGDCECLQVINNGHTVTLNPWDKCHCLRPRISGGGLHGNYTMDNIHFHWPSEHTIDGLQYDLEMHMVFYKDKYGSLKDAIKHPYALTVVAILFSKTNYTASSNFRVLADAVRKVSKRGTTYTKKPVNFHDFLPYDHENFFTYDGSLTTPPCGEFVNWFVFTNHSNIAHFDFQDLTHIYDEKHELLVKNNRDLQELNERIVYMPYFLN